MVPDIFFVFFVQENSLPLPVGERGLELELVVTLLLMKILSLLLGCHSSLSNDDMFPFKSSPSLGVLAPDCNVLESLFSSLNALNTSSSCSMSPAVIMEDDSGSFLSNSSCCSKGNVSGCCSCWSSSGFSSVFSSFGAMSFFFLFFFFLGSFVES